MTSFKNTDDALKAIWEHLRRVQESFDAELKRELEDSDPDLQCLPEKHVWELDSRPNVHHFSISDILFGYYRRERCQRCGKTRNICSEERISGSDRNKIHSWEVPNQDSVKPNPPPTSSDHARSGWATTSRSSGSLYFEPPYYCAGEDSNPLVPIHQIKTRKVFRAIPITKAEPIVPPEPRQLKE